MTARTRYGRFSFNEFDELLQYGKRFCIGLKGGCIQEQCKASNSALKRSVVSEDDAKVRFV